MKRNPTLFVTLIPDTKTLTFQLIPLWQHRSDMVVTHRLLSSTILISVFPNTQFPGFCLPDTDNVLIATVQAKTSPTFCMRLNAPTANLQAYLHRFLGNSNTGGFSWNLMEVRGGKPILDNSAENVLLPGFLLCPLKPFKNCLANYPCVDSRAASTASFRHWEDNESHHQNTEVTFCLLSFLSSWEKI